MEINLRLVHVIVDDCLVSWIVKGSVQIGEVIFQGAASESSY